MATDGRSLHELHAPPAETPAAVPRSVRDAGRVLAALGHAVIVTDLEGLIHYWNPAAEALYGWSAAEVLGREIGTVTVPRASDALARTIMQSLREGGSWSGGFTVQRKDGATFPALVTDSGIYDDDGALVGVVGISTDLGHALRPLLSHSSDAALVLTPDGDISFISPAAAELFGWTDDAVGAPLWDLVHPDDRQAAIDHHRLVCASDATVPSLECRLRKADGSWCWGEMVMTNLLSDPAVRGVVGNLRDTTERHDAREELLTLTEQLQRALTSRVAIEQAKGLLAGRTGTDLDTAFTLLRHYARDNNLTMQDVARAVIDGRLHVPPPRPG
jgi:PAS domain S-box-containing protein